MFKLVSKYQPNGDQPEAIKELVDGVNAGVRDQVLLGGQQEQVKHLQLLM